MGHQRVTTAISERQKATACSTRRRTRHLRSWATSGRTTPVSKPAYLFNQRLGNLRTPQYGISPLNSEAAGYAISS
jgi:hypothetical protein